MEEHPCYLIIWPSPEDTLGIAIDDELSSNSFFLKFSDDDKYGNAGHLDLPHYCVKVNTKSTVSTREVDLPMNSVSELQGSDISAPHRVKVKNSKFVELSLFDSARTDDDCWWQIELWDAEQSTFQTLRDHLSDLARTFDQYDWVKGKGQMAFEQQFDQLYEHGLFTKRKHL